MKKVIIIIILLSFNFSCSSPNHFENGKILFKKGEYFKARINLIQVQSNSEKYDSAKILIKICDRNLYVADSIIRVEKKRINDSLKIVIEKRDTEELINKLNTEIKATIVKIISKGVLVDVIVEDNVVEGFVPLSHLAIPGLRKASTVFKVAEEMPLKIIELDLENRRLILSVKAYFFARDKKELQEYIDGHKVENAHPDELDPHANIDKMMEQHGDVAAHESFSAKEEVVAAPVEEVVEEPVKEEVPEPVAEEVVAAPVEEVVEEPVKEKVPEPVVEEEAAAPVEEVVEEPVKEEVPELVVEEAAAAPVEEVVEEPVKEEVSEPVVEEEAAAPVEEVVEEPVKEEVPEPVVEETPAEEPVEEVKE